MAPLTLIAAYDIHDDDRRAQLAATLQTVGDRVQKSVFVVMVDEPGFVDLQQRVSKIIDTKTDSVLIFRQCAGCWGAHLPFGQGHVPDEVTHWAIY